MVSQVLSFGRDHPEYTTIAPVVDSGINTNGVVFVVIEFAV